MLIKGEEGAEGTRVVIDRETGKRKREGGDKGGGENSKWVTLRTKIQLV